MEAARPIAPRGGPARPEAGGAARGPARGAAPAGRGRTPDEERDCALDKLCLTWQDVERLVERLEGQIGDPGRYDALLVVTRGGMVPACLLSKRTGMRNILVAAVMFYTEEDRPLDRPVFLQFPPDPYLRGRTVLVVDDVWDSGRTVMAVKKRIVDAGGRPVVAVLHYKPGRSLFPGEAPDFYAEVTDAWIVYPWEPRPGS